MPGLSACTKPVPSPSALYREPQNVTTTCSNSSLAESKPESVDRPSSRSAEDDYLGAAIETALGVSYVSPSPAELDLDQAGEDLAALLEKSGLSDDVSLIILAPDQGQTLFSANADLRVNIASTVKVPMALYCCDQAAAGAVDLAETLTYRQALDYEGGSGSLQNTISEGDRLTIGDCLERAIVDSDNTATNMVFRYWRERPEGLSLTQRLNMSYGLDYDDGMATAARMKPVLLKLAQNPDENPYYDILLENMGTTTFNEYLTKPLQDGTYVHKYGDYGGYIGDIGLLLGETRLIFIFYAKSSAGAVELSHEIGAYLSKLSQCELPLK